MYYFLQGLGGIDVNFQIVIKNLIINLGSLGVKVNLMVYNNNLFSFFFNFLLEVMEEK